MSLSVVVETSEFLRASKIAGIKDDERAAIIAHFAANPEDGTPLGGGLFKTRIARTGGGKSGGYRTIHFYRHAGLPVFLLTLFAKNAKASLTSAELKMMVAAADKIGKTYGSGK